MEIPEGGGGSKAQEFSGRERGAVSMNFVFFQTGLNFHTVVLYVKFCCLHFASRVPSERKINLANLKHKMNIFVLVRLGVLLPLESDHFPEKWLVSR